MELILRLNPERKWYHRQMRGLFHWIDLHFNAAEIIYAQVD